MKCVLVILLFFLICSSHCKIDIEVVDVFDEFEESPITVRTHSDLILNKKSPPVADKADPKVTVEDDDEFEYFSDEEEFEHFNDKEEFEGFDTEESHIDDNDFNITIASVPLPFHTKWYSYIMEIYFAVGIVAYFANFYYGRFINARLADIWFKTHKTLLEDNFHLVGDYLVKEYENSYFLWCSGRTCCEGMLVKFNLIKRHDLAALFYQLFWPLKDEVHIKVDMNKEDMDTFVFCVASKNTAIRYSKEMADLSAFCPKGKPGAKYGLIDSFSVLSELGEVSSSILDAKTVNYINKYSDVLDCLHFSDRYSGFKSDENTTVASKLPTVKKVLTFTFTIPTNKYSNPQEAISAIYPLMLFVFQCMERIKRLRISKEAKSKVEKNKLRNEEAFLKTTLAVRTEAASARKGEKKRLEKERILKEDPEKQRKWLEKEMKRQKRKSGPRIRQLVVRNM